MLIEIAKKVQKEEKHKGYVQWALINQQSVVSSQQCIGPPPAKRDQQPFRQPTTNIKTCSAGTVTTLKPIRGGVRRSTGTTS